MWGLSKACTAAGRWVNLRDVSPEQRNGRPERTRKPWAHAPRTSEHAEEETALKSRQALRGCRTRRLRPTEAANSPGVITACCRLLPAVLGVYRPCTTISHGELVGPLQATTCGWVWKWTGDTPETRRRLFGGCRTARGMTVMGRNQPVKTLPDAGIRYACRGRQGWRCWSLKLAKSGHIACNTQDLVRRGKLCAHKTCSAPGRVR